MSFLNAAMLFGLVAAIIPTAIHLFNRQRVSTVEFSSVSFIKSLNLHHSRAMKLRQFLVLLIRTLVILLAVLAFARPTLQGEFWSILGTGVHQKTAIAIVLDNSYSMSTGAAQNTFTQAMATGQGILDELQDGDEATVVLTTAPVRAEPDRPVLGLERVRSVIEEATVSQGAGDMAGALNLASSLLMGTDIVNRAIYVITDLQQTDWQSILQSDERLQINPNISVALIPMSPSGSRNVSIDDISVSGHLVSANQPESVVATFTNRSSEPLRARNVSIFVDGVKRGSRSIDAAAGQSGSVSFSLTPDGPGVHSGYVELDTDDQPLDNRRYFAFKVPDAVEVAVLATGNSGYFLRQVLSPTGPIQTPVIVRGASNSQLSSGALASADVIIVDGETTLSATQLTALRQFVEAGGGLLVFMGGGVDPGVFGNTLMKDVFLCTTPGRMGAPGQRTSYETLAEIDFAHPVFDVFQERSGTVGDSPRFYASYRLEPKGPARVMARFSSGVPAVVEGRLGRGRAILVASAINPRWSDLALKGLFVPFVHRALRYVHSDFTVSGVSETVGQPVERVVDWVQSDGSMMLTKPSGDHVAVIPTATGIGMTAVVTDTDQTGVYEINTESAVLSTFAINVDTRESDPRLLSGDVLAGVLSDLNARIVDSNAPNEQRMFQNTQTYEIWKLLLWLALLLLLTESWLTRASNPAASTA